MRLYKLAAAVAVLLAAAFLVDAPSAFAQYHFGFSAPRHVEITPLFGGTFGGRIDLPNQPGDIDYLKVDHQYDYGVAADVDLIGNLQGQFVWTRQPTNLEAHDFTTGILSPVGSANIDSYQFGVLYQLRQSSDKLRPFIDGGLGFTHWGTNGLLPFNNKLGFTLGGGVKYFFVDHVGMRLGFRWLPTRTTSQLGTFCDPYFGFCYQANVNNYAQQIQLNGGLIFRF